MIEFKWIIVFSSRNILLLSEFFFFFEGLLTARRALFTPYVRGPGQEGEPTYYCRYVHPDQAHVPMMSKELELGDDFEKAQSAI